MKIHCPKCGSTLELLWHDGEECDACLGTTKEHIHYWCKVCGFDHIAPTLEQLEKEIENA